MHLFVLCVESPRIKIVPISSGCLYNALSISGGSSLQGAICSWLLRNLDNIPLNLSQRNRYSCLASSPVQVGRPHNRRNAVIEAMRAHCYQCVADECTCAGITVLTLEPINALVDHEAQAAHNPILPIPVPQTMSTALADSRHQSRRIIPSALCDGEYHMFWDLRSLLPWRCRSSPPSV